MDEDILERPACLEHVQWQEWAQAVGGDIEILLLIIKENVNFDNLDSNQLEVIKRNTRRVKNWPKLMTDYSELSEDMKSGQGICKKGL